MIDSCLRSARLLFGGALLVAVAGCTAQPADGASATAGRSGVGSGGASLSQGGASLSHGGASLSHGGASPEAGASNGGSFAMPNGGGNSSAGSGGVGGSGGLGGSGGGAAPSCAGELTFADAKLES